MGMVIIAKAQARVGGAPQSVPRVRFAASKRGVKVTLTYSDKTDDLPIGFESGCRLVLGQDETTGRLMYVLGDEGKKVGKARRTELSTIQYTLPYDMAKSLGLPKDVNKMVGAEGIEYARDAIYVDFSEVAEA
jgi:hypothetical protein